MTDADQTTVFAGVDGRTDAQLPTWYERETPDTEPVSFAAVVRALPRATETQVAYRNPYSNEWVETERFNAIVEPSRLVGQVREEPRTYGGSESQSTDATVQRDEPDPLFHVPSSSYAIINPTDVYAPLEEILRTTELDGYALGDVAFGEVREYRGGGEVHMDLMFDGLSVDLPGRSDPITMGVTTGYDFFGGHAVYVEGFARDSYCANSIRGLTDRETVKHVGDVGDFGQWWEEILGQLDLVANDLHAFISDAEEITIDFTTVPFDATEFYELLEFPAYLAAHAADDARAEAADPFEIDMWTLHSGATYALTHFFRGKEGSALQRYQRIANDVLFNPEASIERVERAYEQRADEDTDGDGQSGLDSQVALAQIEEVGEDVREKAAQFESREATLRERFAAVGE